MKSSAFVTERGSGALVRPLLLSVLLLMLFAVRPAYADHEITVRHIPPPVAPENLPLPLIVEVESTCEERCEAITVTLFWRHGSGTERSKSQKLLSYELPQAASFTIAAAAVHAPLSYRFEARQWTDVSHGGCQEDRHAVTGRWPEDGSEYHVKVMDGLPVSAVSKATVEESPAVRQAAAAETSAGGVVEKPDGLLQSVVKELDRLTRRMR